VAARARSRPWRSPPTRRRTIARGLWQPASMAICPNPWLRPTCWKLWRDWRGGGHEISEVGVSAGRSENSGVDVPACRYPEARSAAYFPTPRCIRFRPADPVRKYFEKISPIALDGTKIRRYILSLPLTDEAKSGCFQLPKPCGGRCNPRSLVPEFWREIRELSEPEIQF